MAYLRNYVTKPYPSQALRDAIYWRLTNQITDVITYDGTAEKDKDYPLIIIGEETLVDNSTKTSYIDEIVVTIHVYTEEPAYSECNEIMSEIMQWLTQAPLFLADDYTVLGVQLDAPYPLKMRDAYEGRAHGVLKFRFTIQTT